MQAKLKQILAAGLAGAVLIGAPFGAGLAGFFLAGAGVTVMHIDGRAYIERRAALPSPRAENPLLHKVLLKPDAAAPRSFSTRDKREIEEAVRTQIRAYVTRDAEEAFARLAPSTQRFFGEPDKFLRSIAQEVPAMLDTRRFAFLGVEQSGSRTVQQVLITDSTGQEWLAEFQLEQQTGGDWRIKGCVVQSAPGQQAQASSGAASDLA
jgi:hypothetical protein